MKLGRPHWVQSQTPSSGSLAGLLLLGIADILGQVVAECAPQPCWHGPCPGKCDMKANAAF